jgi:two-component system sensor histidine kinase CreC
MKIRTRLLITSILLFAAGSYWLGDWLLKDFRFHYFMTMEESMNDSATLLSSIVSEHVENGTLTLDESFARSIHDASARTLCTDIYGFTKTNMNLRVLVTDQAGMVLFDSQQDEATGQDFSTWRDVRLALQGKYGARATNVIPADPNSLTFFIASPILSNGEIVGTVSVSKPTSSIRPFMLQAKSRLIFSAICAVSAIVLLQVLVSFWVTHPIKELITYARAIRDGRKVPRPPLHRSEMGDLATAFEEMRDALEGRNYVERYVQTLTHEMKSPLSAIQGASELLREEMPDEQRDRFLENIRSESQRAHHLIDRLLALAGLEKRNEIEHPESIGAAALLADILNSLRPVAEKKSIRFETGIEDSVTLYGEAFLLRQALANLLQNAIDFSPDHGIIQITVTRKQQSVVIQLADEGPGIPDYALPRIFERFYSRPRPDHGKKSSGLGLNFVQEVAALHGGNIQICNRVPTGALATLTLPAA